VTDPLHSVLAELEQFGEANDASTTERPRRMLNITRDTGEFLAVLVIATLARRVLEIGTSNGYSTLWLADAARTIGGSVTTVELSEYKIGLASTNFTRSVLLATSRSFTTTPAACSSAPPMAPSISSSLIPNVPSIQDGGGISDAYYGLAACWWSTTPPPTAKSWRRL
jgi:hypothetical protein